MNYNRRESLGEGRRQEMVQYTNKRYLQMYTLVLLAVWALLFSFLFAFVDHPFLIFIGTEEKNNFRLFLRDYTNIGLGGHYFGFSIIVYLFTRFVAPKIIRFQMDPARKRVRFYQEWSKQFFFALCLSGIFMQISKIIAGRQRPHLSPTYLSNIWKPFNFHWDYHSFPSGHTQVMFCFATLMTLLLPKRGLWIFWTLAAFIAFTRVGTLYHFPSDVLTGAFIGHLGALWSLYFFEKKGMLLLSE